MIDATRFYIDGQWIQPQSDDLGDLIDPALGVAFGQVAMGNAADADAAIAAARAAFDGWALSTRGERLRVRTY